ncbi:hypothetical protein [Planococcus donghaensis]|uniref:hypothetical protein n=1 Tax=Planococcus donghaensis TaxID=414778 RepID=UPI001EE33C17|nr:hypothetical protein [Planococcus donghaensis]
MIIFPFSVQAHTALLFSTLSEGQNIAEELTKAELVFDTNIQEGSTMSIEGETGSFEFEDIVIKKM